MPINFNSTNEYFVLPEHNASQLYSVGTDIVEFSRVFRLNKKNPAVFNRLLNDSEKKIIKKCCREFEKTEWTARFFAMKEAVMKSCGIGWQEGVSWQDIELKKSLFTQSTNIRGELKMKIKGLINKNLVVSAKHEKLVVAYAVSLKK
ncbi:4'-phosphopantetheinyl transferase superfamily protein [bacterium]|nr:4'-phosphopantetheinyl transferase superfamily protein [bacterium]